MSRWVADPTHRPTGHQPRHGYLRALLTGLGSDKVTTLLNNGNAVFRVTQGTPQQHAAAISVAITGQLGLQMPVIVQDNPFDTSTLDPSQLLIALVQEPDALAGLNPLGRYDC